MLGNGYSAIAIICSKAVARVYSGDLSECGPAPGGRRLTGQAANLTFESACRLPLPLSIAVCIITQP